MYCLNVRCNNDVYFIKRFGSRYNLELAVSKCYTWFMEWVVVALVLILFALWNIGTHLSSLVKVLQQKQMVSDPSSFDTSGIESQLHKIVALMGGDEKFEAKKERQRRELKERLVKAIMYSEKKSEKDAKIQAEELWEKAEFDEKYSSYAMKFEQYEKWVLNQEKDEWLFKKYNHLLPKMRKYLEDKEKIDKYDSNIQKDLGGIDYDAESWLIDKMIAEKKLKEVKEWDGETESNMLKHYEVVKS